MNIWPCSILFKLQRRHDTLPKPTFDFLCLKKLSQILPKKNPKSIKVMEGTAWLFYRLFFVHGCLFKKERRKRSFGKEVGFLKKAVSGVQGDQTSWRKNGPKCSPIHFFYKLVLNFYRGNSSLKVKSTCFCKHKNGLKQIMPNMYVGKNSPNLATLQRLHFTTVFQYFQNRSGKSTKFWHFCMIKS
jgi:hypothetical protein